MTTQEATPAFQQNLERLCRIIEESFGIGRLTITDQSAMCDFPAYLNAIEKVSAAVGFEVKEGDLLLDMAKRLTETKRVRVRKITTLRVPAVVRSSDEKGIRIHCDSVFETNWRGQYPVVYANANSYFSAGDAVEVEFSGDFDAAFVYHDRDHQLVLFGVVASPLYTQLHGLPTLKDSVDVFAHETWLEDDALDTNVQCTQ